jgi:hypothetical protein
LNVEVRQRLVSVVRNLEAKLKFFAHVRCHKEMTLNLNAGQAFLSGFRSWEDFNELLFGEFERWSLGLSVGATEKVDVVPACTCIVISNVVILSSKAKIVHTALNGCLNWLLRHSTEVKPGQTSAETTLALRALCLGC